MSGLSLIVFFLSYSMSFSSYNGDLGILHRAPDSYMNFSEKYVITGGYTLFHVPFVRFTYRKTRLSYGAFLLSSGKMDRTDVQGNLTGSVYYNAMVLFLKKSILNDAKKGELVIEPGFYLETSDGWYNPGLGVSLYYSNNPFKELYIFGSIKNMGISLNPKDIIDPEGFVGCYYIIYGINPYVTFNYIPRKGLSFWTGLSLPLHEHFTVKFAYTNSSAAFKFGGGRDILTGLSLGISVNIRRIKFNYFADFYGEGGITHTVEMRFSR